MYENLTEKIRKDFPSIIKMEKKNIIYMNNAFLSHKPNIVIYSKLKYYINKIFYIKKNILINKFGYKLNKDVEIIRKKISLFINSNYREIIFTKNTTNSINIIYNIILKFYVKNNDNIIIIISEHDSNIIPWIKISKIKNIKIKFINIYNNGNIIINEILKNINDNTKLILMNHVSNVLGIINPIEKIIKKIRNINKSILFIIDGTQYVMHNKLNINNIKCDFYIFSSSKMYGPEGLGILYINKKILNYIDDKYIYEYGSNIIDSIDIKKKNIKYITYPWKFETGTINYSAIIGLGAAIDYINKININIINKLMIHNTNYFIKKLNEKINKIHIYGYPNKNKISIISFNINNINYYDIGKILEYKNIFIRYDSQCSSYLMNFFKINGLCRASISIYNSKKEIDNFVKELNNILYIFK